MFPGIHLLICKAFHGKLSKEYFFLLQKYKEKYPNLDRRMKKCFRTEAIFKFENLVVRNDTFPVYKTSHPIKFEAIEFGSDIKDILLEKGNTTCANYMMIGEETIKIIGYKEQILNTKATVLFFFINGKYFMGEYFFSKNQKDVSGQLANTILRRYGVKSVKEEIQFYIEDETGSLICFCDNGFYLSLKYFCSAFYQLCMNLRPFFERKFVVNQKQISNLDRTPLLSRI